MNIPEDLSYSKEHEWVQRLDGATIRIGISDFAQDALGDVVFVDLPEVDDDIAVGESVGELESTKSVSELYAPVTGRVTKVNEALEDAPELLNEDPYGKGWLLEIEVTDESDLDNLLTAAQYGELTEG